MAKTCLNQKCILLNLAYNLAPNNFINGLGYAFHNDIEDKLAGFLLIALGIVLVVGLCKENGHLLLGVLILEPLLLAYYTVQAAFQVARDEPGTKPNIFLILNCIGIVFSWLLLLPLYLIYRDLKRKRPAVEQNELTKQATV